MKLDESRRAIRPLLDERNPADAQAVYYAYYHPAEKTQLTTTPNNETRIQGYICVSRTGIDLFRPLVTLRLPFFNDGSNLDPATSANLIAAAIPEGTAVLLTAPELYRPLLGAFFDIQQERKLKVFLLDRSRFEPIINVFVSQSESYNGLPRFIIRQTQDGHIGRRGEIVASAGLNWRSPQFAEIYVHTNTPFRRKGLGRSVVASLVQHVLDDGRTPLYVVNADNEPSIQLAESVGFVYAGATDVMIEGIRRPKP